MDLVSVIVPVYNVEKYLAKCIDSILAQTYQNLEIILVDDGSTDGSSAICDEYAKQDARIKVVHKNNGGLSDARNCGFEISMGDFVCFIDSDDYIDKDMLATLYERIVSDEADISLCDFLYVDEQGFTIEEMSLGSPICEEILTKKQIFSKLERDKNWYYIIACNKMYRRNIFNIIKFPVGKFHEDEFVVHHIYECCNRISCIDKKLYFYVQRSGSITNSDLSGKHRFAMEALYDRVKFASNHFYYTLLIATLNQCINLLIKNKNCIDENIYNNTKNITRKKIRSNMKSIIFRKGPTIEKIRLILYSISPSVVEYIHNKRKKGNS